METGQVTIGEYLINKLYEHGLRHAFGIPGDYVLAFYKQLYDSKIKLINTCDEQSAGYAANAYARVRGLGVVCITYGVGALKVVNTTAQAYAEESPVVVISGAPGIKEQIGNPLLHHKSKNFNSQRKIFEELTVAQAVLDNPETACQEINRVLGAAICYRRPVYIEIPRDMVSVNVTPVEAKLLTPDWDKGPFKEALLAPVRITWWYTLRMAKRRFLTSLPCLAAASPRRALPRFSPREAREPTYLAILPTPTRQLRSQAARLAA